MGDVDMVRALGLAGVQSALFGVADATARFSRHVRDVLPTVDGWEGDDDRHAEVVETLLGFARSQAQPPVLYPQTDHALRLVSRHRDELGEAYHLSLADADLVEQLIDKGRFQVLAERCGLPVPPSQLVHPNGGGPVPDLEVGFPALIKPVVRVRNWFEHANRAKAMRVDGPDEWARCWQELSGMGDGVLVQRLICGPESAIESFHAYVDGGGAIAGEFTGRKIRTYPERFGFSTSVEITDAPDVAQLGREVLARVGLRGVAKVDFKRDKDGSLHLLEINPRFNIWHHPGAIAGVNLPALVHADLSGAPRPSGSHATRRVRWCQPLTDLRAAHDSGISPLAWLRWARGCRAVSGLALDDPLPFIRGTIWQATSPRLGQALNLRRRSSSLANHA